MSKKGGGDIIAIKIVDVLGDGECTMGFEDGGKA
jgi:hypothetical protein